MSHIMIPSEISWLQKFQTAWHLQTKFISLFINNLTLPKSPLSSKVTSRCINFFFKQNNKSGCINSAEAWEQKSSRIRMSRSYIEERLCNSPVDCFRLNDVSCNSSRTFPFIFMCLLYCNISFYS